MPHSRRLFWSKPTKKLTGKKYSITGKLPKITGKNIHFANLDRVTYKCTIGLRRAGIPTTFGPSQHPEFAPLLQSGKRLVAGLPLILEACLGLTEDHL